MENYLFALLGFVLLMANVYILRKTKTNNSESNNKLRNEFNESIKKLRKETPKLILNNKGEAVLQTYEGFEILNYKLEKKK